MPAGRVLAVLANVPDRQRRDGFPQPVIRCEHPVLPVPVFSRWWDEIGEPVQRTQTARVRQRRWLPAGWTFARVPGRPSWRLCVAAARNGHGDAAARVTSHGEPLQREWRLGAVPQEVLQRARRAGSPPRGRTATAKCGPGHSSRWILRAASRARSTSPAASAAESTCRQMKARRSAGS